MLSTRPTEVNGFFSIDFDECRVPVFILNLHVQATERSTPYA